MLLPPKELVCGSNMSAWVKITSLNAYCVCLYEIHVREIIFIKATNDVFKNKQTNGNVFISSTIGVVIWRCSLGNYSGAIWASGAVPQTWNEKPSTRWPSSPPFLIIFNNPENTKKASISEVLPPSHQSHIPLHISLIYWRETEAPLQASAIICSFRGPAPEVLHSVRTSNVDSILAAIRPHPLEQTCSFVSPPLLPSSRPSPSIF